MRDEIAESIKKDLRAWWHVISLKGMKNKDRLKIWGTEFAAFMLLCTIERFVCLLAALATAGMAWWTSRTIDKEALDNVMKVLDE